MNKTHLTAQNVLLCCWLLLLAGPGRAQQRLSLAEALRLGLTNNADVQAASQREALAQTSQRIGVGERLPTVDLGLGQTNYVNQYNSPTNFVRGFYQDNALTGGLSGSWLLYNGGRVGLAQARLDGLSQQAGFDAQTVRQQVGRDIAGAYYRAVLEADKRAVRAEGKALSKARWQDFRAQERLGKASLFDVVQAETLFLIDSTAYLQQELDELTAQSQLLTVMGSNRLDPVLLTDSLRPGPAPTVIATLGNRVLGQNPDLRSRRTAVQLAGIGVSLQKTALKPVVRLNSSVSQSLERTKFVDIPQINGSTTNWLVAGLSVSWPVVRSREVDRAIRQAEVEQGLTALALKGAERRLLVEAGRLVQAHERQTALVGLSGQVIGNAARALTIARNRLQSGFSNLTEYRLVQLAYTEARLAQLQALYALKLTEADAVRLAGSLR